MRQFRGLLVAAAIAAVAYAGYVAGGVAVFQAPAEPAIRVSVQAPVSIRRDERGIPHIRARDERDAFFAEGYAQASDRLFQMDLYRRYIYGQLAEILGPIQLRNDETLRALDVHDIVDREWSNLPPVERADISAFSDGVNAAMQTRPLPLEFRLLLYQPRPWTPRDSLAVTLAISVSLGDTVETVLQRDALWRSLGRARFDAALPLSDPAYDVSIAGVPDGDRASAQTAAWIHARPLALQTRGSNAWAAGGARSKDLHALIASDPHLTLSVPGVWYVVDLAAPGFHAAGVTVPGVPGVILGHNERIAWATTNAMASAFSVFNIASPNGMAPHEERFRVRLSRDVVKTYFRTASAFAMSAATGSGLVLVRWPPYAGTHSALETVFALDRSATIDAALRDLAHYAGPPQNFILAGSDGRVAYHLAGPVVDDPAWGRYVHGWADARTRYPVIAFNRLPHSLPSSGGVIVSANNKMYAAGYPYRLSAMFAPPYRAYRIAQLLHERARYDVDYFASMQLDVQSPVDAEFAHRLASYAAMHGMLSRDDIDELNSWNGAFDSQSRAATLTFRYRSMADASGPSPYAAFGALRGGDPPGELLADWRDASLAAAPLQPWGLAGAVPILHPLGAVGFPFLNAGVLPGNGDAYTIHVQDDTLSQSFRAVWDVPDWDRGGLSIPAGESGAIGSPHYDDLRERWIRGTLEPLPFSDAAVQRSTRSQLELQPSAQAAGAIHH